MSRFWSCVVLLLATAVATPACDSGLDCGERRETAARESRGQQVALELNQRDFDRGYDDGLALTREEGERDGYASAYDDAYAIAYSRAYSVAFDENYGGGRAAGLDDEQACVEGDNNGSSAGVADGFDDGYAAGAVDGAADGYNTGYEEGLLACNQSFAPQPSPQNSDEPPTEQELNTCYQRGFDGVRDALAYGRGFDAGRADNPDYQDGYRAGFGRGAEAGDVDGDLDGWERGAIDGFAAGYADGADATYADCFDSAYSSAFDGAYPNGYDVGYADAFDANYVDGYADGLNGC